MSKLIICEKNNAARRISQILSGRSARRSKGKTPIYNFTKNGEEYHVIGLRGHVTNLDYPKELNDWRKTPLEELIESNPNLNVSNPASVGLLRSLLNDVDDIIIATDYDREGELIGVDALSVSGGDPETSKRARFSALTNNEVMTAFDNLGEVDMNLANSAKSRNYIDLVWGAVLTRYMSISSGMMGHDYLSIGRVQTPTLALIVDRHKEIENFVSQPFWTIIVKLDKDGNRFDVKHIDNPFYEEEKAEKIMETLKETEKAVVEDFSKEVVKEYSLWPMNTTEFIKETSSKLRIRSSTAMKVAEDLYMKGKISYPRTDNTQYPRGTPHKSILANLKKGHFKKEAEKILAQDKIIPRKGKKKTTDHPPIHPVDNAGKDKLSSLEWKVYELIVRRYLSTLAPPAEVEKRNVRVSIAGEILEGKGATVIFEGWREYYKPYLKDKTGDVPDLSVGEELDIYRRNKKEDKTKPPSHYYHGTLIVEMEKKGLGTKSTRHEMINKLQKRKYLHGSSRLEPTPSGIALIEVLEKNAPIITKPDMTAELEEEMDEIKEGRKELGEVIEDSKNKLRFVLSELKEKQEAVRKDIREALSEQHVIGACPNCDEKLVIRKSRKGQFIGCRGYPECKTSFPLPRGSKVETTEEICEECEHPMVKVTGNRAKKGLICINNQCQTHRERDYVGVCPKCGSDLMIRVGRSGKRFVGCSNYPKCKNSYPLPQRGKVEITDDLCEECGLPVVKIITKGRKPWVKCLDMNCGKDKKKKKSKKKK